MARRKNVLFIWTDEQRPDTIGAYGKPHRGREMRTPHVDQLAAMGILFEQAYCTQPVCSPSRASVLTGLYPHSHGVPQNNIPLPKRVPSLAEMLRPAGYACGYVGKWHLGNELGRVPPGRRGFDDCWISTEDTYTRDRAAEGFSDYRDFLITRGYTPADEAQDGATVFSRPTAARLPEEVSKPAFQATECIRFLETCGTDRDRPFLLVVNFLEPHPPFFSPLDGMYSPEDMSLPASWYREMEETVPERYRRRRRAYEEHFPHAATNDERGWKEVKARYWGQCTLVDKYAGKILQRLDELGLAEDTIVVYSTDHGDMMGEHRLIAKSVQYEGATRVPLIVRVPGATPKRIATPTSQVHLVPTLLELLGQSIPAHLQGASLVPLLTHGDAALAEGEVFIEWNGLERQIAGGGDLSDPREGETQLRAIDVRTIRRGHWKLNVHLSGECELYNLQDDPGETHNALHDPGREPAVRALFERLITWQRETNDTIELPQPPCV